METVKTFCRLWPRLKPATVAGALAVAGLVALALSYALRPAPICFAAADTLSGPSAPAGQEAVTAMQIHIDEVNRAGGVDGREIKLVPFDDRGSAATARANVAAIAASGCLAVLGHRLSATSVAAGPGYMAAHIPALTGMAHADSLTLGNPWYFRAQNTSSLQGRAIGEYVRIVLEPARVHLVTADADFDRGFGSGFGEGFGREGLRIWSFSSDGKSRAASLAALTRELGREIARVGGSATIVLGTGEDNLPDAIMAIRRQGIDAQIVAAAGAGSEQFLLHFAGQPEEIRQPGFFGRNLLAAAPLIFDSLGTREQAIGAAYSRKTGRTPGWIAGSAYNAARIMVEAVRRAHVAGRRGSVGRDRERVRAALAGMNSRDKGVAGLGRTLWFDAGRNMPQPIRIGSFLEGRFQSAPEQLVPLAAGEPIDPEQLARGDIVASGDRRYWRQRVVYAGIDVNRLSRIDLKEGSFFADLNFWLWFSGDDAPTRVEFPRLLDRGAFDPARPVETGASGGRNYRLYRIAGNFKADYDLHDYPFDEQQLLIHFRNQQQRRELVTYAIDRPGLGMTGGNFTLPADVSPFGARQQWRLRELRYFADWLSSSSTLGKPPRFSGAGPVEYSGLDLAIVIDRNSGIYIVKSMVPLLLLVLVVLATLFLPGNLFRERINIPVTAILTSAVLLLSVNNQIGEIGYVVAIEYVYYAFFALCLISMLIGITHDRFSLQGREAAADRVARAGQLFYALSVVLGTGLFWFLFAR